MIDWRKLYMTYQTLNLSQAVDIFVNSSEEDLKTLPRSEQISIYKDRETARATILQSLYANSFVHGRAGNKYIDTDERFIIIERKSYLDWCSEIGVNLEGFIKHPNKSQNIADKDISRSILIQDDMSVTLKAVISAWNEFGPDIQNQKIAYIKSWIKSHSPGLTDQKYAECAQVLTGGNKPGRAPKSRARHRGAEKA